MTDISNISNQNPAAYVKIGTEAEEQTRKSQQGVDEGQTSTLATAKTEIDAQALEAKIEKIITQIAGQQKVSGDILSQIIRLLIELVPVLQRIGTAQANQMTLATNMQRLYTELIAKAPVYRKGVPGEEGKIFDEKDAERDARLRGEANNNISIWTEQLRSYRDTWSDYAKKLQANINTTNEAVNQQIDLLTSFLQQLRELVSLITR